MPVQFKDFLSLDDFEKLLSIFPYGKDWKENDDAQKLKDDAYYSYLEIEFGPMFQNFLTCLRDEGRLAKADSIEGRLIRFASQWNCFVSNSISDEWELKNFLDAVSFRLTNQLLFSKLSPRKEDERSLEVRYQELLDIYDQGTIGFLHTGSRDDYDFVSGEKFYFEIENWQPSWMDYNYRTRTKTKAGPVDIATISEMQVEFKTGELLISDWFRIEEFTEGTKLENQYSREFDLNSVMGKEATCRAHWEKDGFISVNLGNTSPRIYEIEGTLTFGRMNSDWERQQWNARGEDSLETNDPVPQDVRELGRVCTDLWATTVIERSRLVEIVAEKLGIEEAEKKIAAYLLENQDFIVECKVEPGPHYLYWSGNHHRFKDNFASPNLKIPEGIEPVFILSPRKLNLTLKDESVNQFKP